MKLKFWEENGKTFYNFGGGNAFLGKTYKPEIIRVKIYKWIKAIWVHEISTQERIPKKVKKWMTNDEKIYISATHVTRDSFLNIGSAFISQLWIATTSQKNRQQKITGS